MYIVINGGGKVGSFLAQTLHQKKHSVAVIEKRPNVIEKLAEELPQNVLLIQGDGCDPQSQEDAGVGHADVFVAVTRNDDDNLVSCQLARVNFNVKIAVARVNSPKNEPVFNALGIRAISSTSVIGHLIEEEMTVKDIIRLHTLEKGNLSLVEFVVPAGDREVFHKTVSELALPEKSVLVTIMREDKVIIPRGNTEIEPGDRIIALADIEHEDELSRIFSKHWEKS
jgi:trk system potassium uptake protein TrkA